MTEQAEKTNTILDLPKFFVYVVGIAAAVAVVLIGVKGEAPTTFLGGLAFRQDVLTSRLYIEQEAVSVQKGRSFSVDISLESGKLRPSDVVAVLEFDPKVLEVTYVDMKDSTLAKTAQKQAVYDNKTGTVRITGTMPELAEDAAGQFAMAKVYFRASQNIGTTELGFKMGTSDSRIFSGDRDGNILAETDGSIVSVTLQ